MGIPITELPQNQCSLAPAAATAAVADDGLSQIWGKCTCSLELFKELFCSGGAFGLLLAVDVHRNVEAAFKGRAAFQSFHLVRIPGIDNDGILQAGQDRAVGDRRRLREPGM